MTSVVHIINPVDVAESSDLFIAQPITFESLLRSRTHNKESMGIELMTVQFSEDKKIIPTGFFIGPDLDRSIKDYSGFEDGRKLPFISDILKKSELIDADYIIYSNVDIAVQLDFYEFVHKQILNGFDGFIINRRTISDKYKSVSELEDMYKDFGQSHPGYDCFVIKRENLEKFVLDDIIIGTAYIGLALYLNMRVFSDRFKEFGDEHKTFHIGNDQSWKQSKNNKYLEHNTQCFERIKSQLIDRFGQDSIDQILEQAFPTLSSNSTKTTKVWYNMTNRLKSGIKKIIRK